MRFFHREVIESRFSTGKGGERKINGCRGEKEKKFFRNRKEKRSVKESLDAGRTIPKESCKEKGNLNRCKIGGEKRISRASQKRRKIVRAEAPHYLQKGELNFRRKKKRKEGKD